MVFFFFFPPGVHVSDLTWLLCNLLSQVGEHLWNNFKDKAVMELMGIAAGKKVLFQTSGQMVVVVVQQILKLDTAPSAGSLWEVGCQDLGWTRPKRSELTSLSFTSLAIEDSPFGGETAWIRWYEESRWSKQRKDDERSTLIRVSGW